MLKSLADSWTEVSREGDLLARIGGVEFVAVMPAADATAAEEKPQKKSE